MTERCVIVGGAGFLGTALAQGLRKSGREVCVLDLPQRLAGTSEFLAGIETRPFSFPKLDGLEEAISGSETLIHLACTTTPASSMADMAKDAAENIAPSVALFEAASRAGVKRILFSSSGGTVYGEPKALPVSEEAAGNALSAYGTSKLAIEGYLHLVATQAGLTGVSLRIGNPYGPFQLRGTAVGVIAHYLAQIRSGIAPEVWGDGSVVRDYIHIDDVVAAVLAVIETPELASGPYNLGSGEGHSIKDIYAAIRQVTGTQLDLQLKPARGFDVAAIFLDTTRLRRATGWQPRVGLNEGIAQLWELLQRS
ncbi:NAD-dependent epimerase/dehydratase family protein [Yangia mangrovi]|uniref:UDP-glucose 4-epimerase n=1 Tax=Alloyangia mangrovi TaxID=1779329 RepID=A0A2A3JY14_9RHOB|nr:NAD-dependent epimerase/dehydratase family protein [Alloyangia mangrovi]MCT4372841.1 NAD-dependent epimerase/dehydratase family protein [Alloyangia mangrovi]